MAFFDRFVLFPVTVRYNFFTCTKRDTFKSSSCRERSLYNEQVLPTGISANLESSAHSNHRVPIVFVEPSFGIQ